MLGITFVDAVVKAKKAKKAKKEKSKSKNAEKQKRRPSSSGEGSSGGDDDAAAGRAKQGSSLQPAVQREEWMTVPMTRTKTDAQQQAEAEAEAAAAAAAAALKAREEPEVVAGLRHTKPGSTEQRPAGLESGPASPGRQGAQRPASGPGVGAGGVVGDGGLSWRLKALRRAQEQAAAGGAPLAQVVAERWGSLGQLTSALTEGRAADAKAHLHAARGRERGVDVDPPGPGRPPGRGLGPGRDESSQMRRPSLTDSLSWRKGGRKDRSSDVAAQPDGPGSPAVDDGPSTSDLAGEAGTKSAAGAGAGQERARQGGQGGAGAGAGTAAGTGTGPGPGPDQSRRQRIEWPDGGR
ncbi:hypothetical protein QJQ45_021883, partial [Haematococcus lacustris]